MADVSRRTAGAGGERAQLLLVGALALAVLLVSLALLLNTAIYTENLATRSSDPGSADAVTLQRDATAGVGGLVERTNAAHATDDAALAANLTAAVAAWDNASARHYAVDARASNVSVRSATLGTQVVQRHPRNFTNATGTPGEWTVVAGVNAARDLRAFRVVTDPANLSSVPSPAAPSASNLASTFHVNVTETDDDWRRIHVYANGSEVQVASFDGTTVTTSGNCSAAPTAGNVTVDFTEGTVGGTECEALAAFSTADSAFDLSYHEVDSGAIVGTYSLVVNQSFTPGLLVGNGGSYEARSSGRSPYAAPAVYAVDVDVAYDSRRVSYRSTVRVAPGEAGG